MENAFTTQLSEGKGRSRFQEIGFCNDVPTQDIRDLLDHPETLPAQGSPSRPKPHWLGEFIPAGRGWFVRHHPLDATDLAPQLGHLN